MPYSINSSPSQLSRECNVSALLADIDTSLPLALEIQTLIPSRIRRLLNRLLIPLFFPVLSFRPRGQSRVLSASQAAGPRPSPRTTPSSTPHQATSEAPTVPSTILSNSHPPRFPQRTSVYSQQRASPSRLLRMLRISHPTQTSHCHHSTPPVESPPHHVQRNCHTIPLRHR